MESLEYDRKLTRRNADRLLRGYRQMARMAGDEFVPKLTATLTLEPVSHTGNRGTPIESHVARKADGLAYLRDVTRAMNQLDTQQRELLWYRYCDNQAMTDIQIYMGITLCSERQYYRLLERALLAFAESYQHGRLIAE